MIVNDKINRVVFSWIPNDIKIEDRTNPDDFDEKIFDILVTNMKTYTIIFVG